MALGAACAVALAACTIEPRTDRSGAQEPADTTSSFVRLWRDAPPTGVRSGDLVWIWGMTGVAPGSVPPRLVPGGASAEVVQALQNLEDALGAAGVTIRDVGQCSLFVADAADLPVVLRAYAERFPGPPRRAAVAETELTLGARVEIECTAVVPETP